LSFLNKITNEGKYLHDNELLANNDNRPTKKSMKSKKHQIIIPDDYRILQLGEIRVSGDQYLLGKKWKPCNGIGIPVQEMDHPVIRKLDNSKANVPHHLSRKAGTPDAEERSAE